MASTPAVFSLFIPTIIFHALQQPRDAAQRRQGRRGKLAMNKQGHVLRSSPRLAKKSAKPTVGALTLGGTTAKHRHPMHTQDNMQLDICDSSSDDGDSLQTPISDSAHLVQIAFNGSSPVLQNGSESATAGAATTAATHLPSLEKPQNYTLVTQKRDIESSATSFPCPPLPSLPNLHQSLPQPQAQNNDQLSPSASSHSSSSFSASASGGSHEPSLSFASSASSADFHLNALCSYSSLLDSSLSFEGSASSTSSEFSPKSLDTSSSSAASCPSSRPPPLSFSSMHPFSRFAPPPSSPLAQSFSVSQLETHDAIEEGNPPPSPIQADARPSPQARKRLPDTQTPLTNTRPGQKPKLSRSFASEFLPSTLGRSYSNRFPPDHRLRPDFVREYALDGELGKGGYGFVMAARHRRDGHEVAVKFITKAKIPPVSWSVDDCGRPVPKEARLLSQLDHPGIVKFLDLFEDDVYFYLVSPPSHY